MENSLISVKDKHYNSYPPKAGKKSSDQKCFSSEIVKMLRKQIYGEENSF